MEHMKFSRHNQQVKTKLNLALFTRRRPPLLFSFAKTAKRHSLTRSNKDIRTHKKATNSSRDILT